LNKHPVVHELVFCLDNDLTGRKAAMQLAREYAYRGYTALNEPPRGKDYNEDLQTLRAQTRAEKQPQIHRHEER